MTTSAQQIRAALVAAAQGSATAAAAAGMSTGAWSSTTVPHVFSTPGSPLGHQNRGRLPFVEFISQEVTPAWDTQGGGEQTSNVIMRVHVGGANEAIARSQAEAIALSCLTAIRSEAVNNYLSEGQQVLTAFQVGPLWHKLDVTMTFMHQWDLGNFGNE